MCWAYSSRERKHVKRLAEDLRKKDSFFGGIIATTAFLALLVFSPHFHNPNNLDSLQAAIAPNAIIAVGMMILMIMGMFDLSVGSIMGFSGIVTGYFISRGYSIPIAVLAGMATGCGIGLINGLLVAYGKILPIIATIGTMIVFRGFAEMIMTSNMAMSLTGFPREFIALGNRKLLGIYPMLWICIIMLVLFWFITKMTYAGRVIYYIGNSAENAKLMGIDVNRTVILAFLLSGVLSALAGILSVARFESASRYLGQNLQMTILIACIIGGGSILGGKGDMLGALFGTIFIVLLSNGFNLFEVNPQWQSVTIGAILLLVVVANGYFYLKKMRRLGKL